ncbi:MAG: GtrA family protein [Pseudomonadota bacterium]
MIDRLAALWTERSGRILRFAIVGIGGTLLYAGLAFGGLALGWPLMIAHTVAYAISLFASYLGQKIFTFGIRGEHRRNGTRFMIATVILASIQALLVWGLDSLGVPEKLTLLASTLYYPPASFLLHTFWTFRKPKPAPR